MKFKTISFNGIQNYILIKFRIISFNEIIIQFYKTALYMAVEKENIEIVNLLLNNNKIDVNIINIYFYFI